MAEPGFTRSLREELRQVHDSFQARVHRKGALPDAELVSLVTRLDADPAMYHPEQATAADAIDLSALLDEERAANDAVGQLAIAAGHVAFVVMAGGAGTRMGGPKLFAQIPGLGTSLLAWKVMQGAGIPTWIMVSPGEMGAVAHHVKKLALPPNTSFRAFEQFEGYRLAPDNRLAWLSPGVPDLCALGNGDVGPALVESDVLDDHPNVKHVIVCNVDNVLAGPWEEVLGLHVTKGNPVTCEVVDRRPGDGGGTLVHLASRVQVAEAFRLPPGFADAGPFLSTNTMVVDADVLRSNIAWRWHRVRKQAGHRLVIQHERFLQQYTEEFATTYVRVDRAQRHLPVKTHEDLEAAGQAMLANRYV